MDPTLSTHQTRTRSRAIGSRATNRRHIFCIGHVRRYRANGPIADDWPVPIQRLHLWARFVNSTYRTEVSECGMRQTVPIKLYLRNWYTTRLNSVPFHLFYYMIVFLPIFGRSNLNILPKPFITAFYGHFELWLLQFLPFPFRTPTFSLPLFRFESTLCVSTSPACRFRPFLRILPCFYTRIHNIEINLTTAMAHTGEKKAQNWAIAHSTRSHAHTYCSRPHSMQEMCSNFSLRR